MPTVTLITEPFTSLAKGTAEEHGLPWLKIVVLPARMDLSSKDEIRQIVDEYFDEIVTRLTR